VGTARLARLLNERRVAAYPAARRPAAHAAGV